MIEATLLTGGPLDGLVANTSGRTPVIIYGKPHPQTLLDELDKQAVWVERLEWYEAQ